MSTFKYLVTALFYQFLTSLGLTDLLKCWSVLLVDHLQVFEAKPALYILKLIASLTQVVWLRATERAEVLLTLVASDTMLSHVLGSFLRQLLSLFVFEG